jgi:AcrR family transcriptional regulator
MAVKDKQRTARDPIGTRHAILNAATAVLAADGPDLLNVSKVAHLAGVNRGTAYKYFQTREDLANAAIERISEQLFTGVFGKPGDASEQDVTEISIEDLTVTMVDFAMENPDVGRVWLLETLSSRKADDDLFWNRFSDNFAKFTKTEKCETGVDSEVLSVLFLGAFFLWPVFVKAQHETGAGRKNLAKRFSREIMRLVAHGIVQPDRILQRSASPA